MAMELKHISKQFDGNIVFKDFDISFREGVISCILGPSGCGKTTLLNMMGGVTAADGGDFNSLNGKRFSYIFQAPRLLPWKTVAENIGFVMDRNITASERQQKLDYLLQMVEMNHYAQYYPSQLSGGMAQRVSIARAFAIDSDVILMDEPFSGLDITLKKNIMERFVEIWKRDKRTVVYVTHDIDEALLLSDEIIVFSKAPVKIVAQTQVDKDNLQAVKDLILKSLV